MQIYNVHFPLFTPGALVAPTGGVTTGSVYAGIVFPGTNRSWLLLEIDAEGSASASAPGVFSFFRTITTAAVGALTTVVTPQPIDSLATAPVFSGSAGQGTFATTQPTLAGNAIHSFGLNANGQRYFWRANPNLNNAIVVPGTATALLGGLGLVQVTATGTSAMAITVRLQIAEL